MSDTICDQPSGGLVLLHVKHCNGVHTGIDTLGEEKKPVLELGGPKGQGIHWHKTDCGAAIAWIQGQANSETKLWISWTFYPVFILFYLILGLSWLISIFIRLGLIL